MPNEPDFLTILPDGSQHVLTVLPSGSRFLLEAAVDKGLQLDLSEAAEKVLIEANEALKGLEQNDLGAALECLSSLAKAVADVDDWSAEYEEGFEVVEAKQKRAAGMRNEAWAILEAVTNKIFEKRKGKITTNENEAKQEVASDITTELLAKLPTIKAIDSDQFLSQEFRIAADGILTEAIETLERINQKDKTEHTLASLSRLTESVHDIFFCITNCKEKFIPKDETKKQFEAIEAEAILVLTTVNAKFNELYGQPQTTESKNE